MKKFLLTMISSVMVSIFITMSALAMPYNPNNYTSVNEYSALLPAGVKQSKVSEGSRARGDFFASADLSLRNNGDGSIGVLAIAFTRFPVDEAYITVYLDRWDESTQRWKLADQYEAEFYKADYPDGLTEPAVNISFLNQPTGYFYRIRGVFAVVYNNEFEGFSPTTDGVLID